jgi:hypothetical protein
MKPLLLVSALFIASPAPAQEMIEIPTDPSRIPPPPPKMVPAPDPTEPLPPPIAAPAPQTNLVWRVERRTDLAIVGAVGFTTTYALNLGLGLWAHANSLAIPIAGPIVQIVRFGPNPMAMTFDFMLLIDACVQAGGVVMAIAMPSFKRWQLRPQKGR